nr:MAG TPA: hypothetical protein [Caudoviricetes sp.]
MSSKNRISNVIFHVFLTLCIYYILKTWDCAL